MSREDYFVPPDGSLDISQCIDCKYKHIGYGTCDAFPESIPDEILENKHDHKNPYPGDNDIRYEKEQI